MEETIAFKELKKMIFDERGLDCDQYKENYLKRRFAVRMRALHMETYADYIKVFADTDEMNILLDKLTINVTQFFRDPEMFIEFENEVLPDIIREKKDGLKIWSAGCSTGDEPYSIAMSIEEVSEKMGIQGYKYEIYATDFDRSALYRAIEGKYEERTMENIATIRRAKYFTEKNGIFQATDHLKRNVKFNRLNMMNPYKEDFFDIVFCRNVIIYFTKDLQREVMQFFHNALVKDGLLILGKTETMLLDYRDRFKCINVRERMFNKI